MSDSVPPPPPPPGGGALPPPPPPPPASYELRASDTRVRAGFWQRVAAALIDGLIFIVVLAPIVIGMVALGFALPRRDPEPCLDFDGNLSVCEPLTGPSILLLVVLGFGILAVMVFVWSGLLVGRRGLTPGRSVLNIQVVDIRSGEPIGVGRGIGRYVITFPIGFIPCGGFLDVLWMLWDDEKQTLHDKVVSSVVVRTDG